jgi:N-acetyl sugar amidotransferase
MTPMLDAGRRCARCLYHEQVPGISFDESGVCSYCKLHDDLNREYSVGAEGRRHLERLASTIRRAGRGKPYDVVVGVSGGCDSSYLVYMAKELGLRPLAVHFDNTWDSEIAVRNIRRVLKALDVDLYTYVVDNEEYDDIYRSFLRAGVPDIEAPTDIALAAVLNMAAEKHGVSYVFEGHSFRTEGISPIGWLYMDAKYIASVHDRFGEKPLRTFPNLWLKDQIRWMVVRGIQKIRPLYWMDYHKEDAMQLLTSKLGWQWYGGHHLENRFTAFYHSYFMPRRFGIDTRLLGHSALIRSGQMTREEGLRAISEPRTFEPSLLAMVKKRLGFSDEEFEQLMTMPRHTDREFETYRATFRRLRWFFWLMYRLNRIPKSFYIKFAAPQTAPLTGSALASTTGSPVRTVEKDAASNAS